MKLKIRYVSQLLSYLAIPNLESAAVTCILSYLVSWRLDVARISSSSGQALFRPFLKLLLGFLGAVGSIYQVPGRRFFGVAQLPVSD